MLLRILLYLYLSIGIMGAAKAWECTPYSHRYFILCDAHACKAAFSVAEVETDRQCGRRAVVEAIDAQEGILLSEIVTQVHTPAARGLYEFALETYGSARDVSAAALWRLGGNENGSLKLARISADFTQQAVDARRASFEMAVRSALRWRIFFLTISWASSIIVLFVLLRPLLVGIYRFVGLNEGARAKRWSTPATIQFILATAGAVAVAFFAAAGPFHIYWGNVLLVPVAVLVLLCEAWAWSRRR
jgi:hypothetical protein